ncbi:bacteriorhodopsin [Dictyobacter aurantiacus]|uniref:Rhodopsin n=1 Tax=Dictyobacter aurantiacus TaxID=1936993 RepID=A0A401ZCY9_9CHLR|nr:bacteriorhodopsin [Dictyobacter aurantiacus]GCE04747.1 rhodopsin [Dictyobacter aurantiacus]
MSTTTIILWIGTAIMTLGLLAFLGLTLKAPTENRSFFTITSLIALIAATAYFAMVTGYGSIVVGGRTFYFARYIDWVFTTPLLLLDLSLLALPTLSGNWNRIGTMIAADVYMIITGLVAGLINSNFKYVWFIASAIAFIVVLYNLLGYLFPLAAARGGEVKQLFNTLSILTAVLWICYPIVWLLGTEGIRLFSLPLEVGLFAILDILAKVGFGFVLLTSGVVLGREAARRRAIPAM